MSMSIVTIVIQAEVEDRFTEEEDKPREKIETKLGDIVAEYENLLSMDAHYELTKKAKIVSASLT